MAPSVTDRYARWTLVLLAVVSLFRLVYITHLDLVGDEAYYWLWSRHPDYCYLDKGPMIAWFISAGTAFFGQNEFGVRISAVLLSTWAAWGLFVLGRRLFSPRVGFWTVVLATLTPLYTAGALLMTIDTLYVAFWIWAAWAVWRAKESDRLGPWLLAGVLLGLGIWSKYTAAVQLVSFALFAVWDPDMRRQLRRPGIYAMIAVALLFFVPAIIWNWQHGWPTTRWLVHRGALDEHAHFQLGELFKFLGGQAGLLTPLFFLGLLAAVCIPRLGNTPASATRFVLSLFLPLFLLYTLLSFHHASQPNWTAAAYSGGLLLLVAKWDERAHTERWARNLALFSLGFAALATVVMHETRWLHPAFKYVHNLTARPDNRWTEVPPGKDPLDRARGARELAHAVAQLQKDSGAEFVMADRYMTAALLSFYLPDHPEPYLPLSSAPYNQLVLWPNYRQAHPTGNALLVCDSPQDASYSRQEFATQEPLGVVDTTSGGRVVKRYYVFLCRR